MPRNHPSNVDPRRWRAVRRKVLERDGERCPCGAHATDVDHIQPVFQGGAWWSLDNLQALCATCHKAKSRQEQRPLGPKASSWRDFANALLQE